VFVYSATELSSGFIPTYWYSIDSNVFQPSCCIIIVGLPLLLDERPDWLCGLLQSFITDRAARLLAASIWWRHAISNMFIDIIKLLFYSDLPQTAINKAINDLRRHLNACVSADGGHFEHIMW